MSACLPVATCRTWNVANLGLLLGVGAGCGPQVREESGGDGVQLRVRLSPAGRLPIEGKNLVREQVKPALHSGVDIYRDPRVRILSSSAVLIVHARAGRPVSNTRSSVSAR